MSFNDHAYWWVKSMIKTKKKWLPVTLLSSWGNVRLRPFQTLAPEQGELRPQVQRGGRCQLVVSLEGNDTTDADPQLTWQSGCRFDLPRDPTSSWRQSYVTFAYLALPARVRLPFAPSPVWGISGPTDLMAPLPLEGQDGGNFVWLNLFYWS